MTIRRHKDSLLDKLLRAFGFRQKTLPPKNTSEIYEKFGPYVDIKAKKGGVENDVD